LKVHLVNPSDNSFGTAVITPRWLFVLAAATPTLYGDPILVDESLGQIDPESIHPGDAVGIGIHTGNALRGYALGRMARERGAWVIFGGIHATLFPEESFERGGAHAVAELAYGTKTVPRVDKIVGPGNRYVAAAKAIVARDFGHRALEFTRTDAVDVVYWPTLDPTAIDGSRETRLDAYRGVRDGLIKRIRELLGVRPMGSV